MKVTFFNWYKPMCQTFSRPGIGTDSCYGLFERGEKTVQAKNIKIFVSVISKKIVLPIMLFWPAYAPTIRPPTHLKPTFFDR